MSGKADEQSAARVAIVFDGSKWFARHIRVIEHDLKRDEKVYRCNRPIGGAFDTAEEALAAARKEFPDEH